MQKSISSPIYATFLKCLRKTREDAGVTQEELAELVGETQSFISKCERGERRIDIAELREFCLAIDISLEKFVKYLESELSLEIKR